jgi:hypothetical protein
MRESQNNRRFWEVMIGLFLLIVGLAAFGGGEAAFMPLMLGLLGLWLVAKQFDRTRRDSGASMPAYEDEDVEIPSRHPEGEQVYTHAVQAIRRAGRDPNETHVLPVDIGVMAYRADQEPVVYRSQPVYDDVDYLQPFVLLRLPTRATGRIRFELVDSDGQTLFIHEDNHNLQRGRNLVTPSSRLPIHDAQAMHGNWELRVSADGVLLASHTFGWRERTDKVIRRQLREDGEISNELRAAIVDSQPGSLSLDDLLSYQDDSEQEVGGRR